MKLNFNRYKKGNSKRAIIAIHGWGGNSDSFLPFVENLKISNIDWVLPEAPYLVNDAPPVNSGDSWSDNDASKKSWTYKKSNGLWEIEEPITMLDMFFKEVIFKEYDSKDVYVLGFSQGAAVCYEYIMGIQKSLGGIFPIGGFLFKDSSKRNRVSLQNKNTPIIIGHGNKDEVIPIDKSKAAYNQLLEEGANVSFIDYNGGHKISMNYLKQIIKVIDAK